MRPSQLLAGVVALSSVSAAWPDVFDKTHEMMNLQVRNIIYGRDDPPPSSSQPQTQPPSSSQGSQKTDAPQSSGQSSASPSENNQSSGSSKPTSNGKDQPSGGSNSNSTSKPTPTQYDPRLPAGGIQLITPAAIAGPQFYKVGDWVTIAWNYTSLSQTPKNLDILATCTANQATYTLAVNHSATDTTLLWDTAPYKSGNPPGGTPLLTETYTLIMYDAESSVSATPQAGYLGVFNDYQFGMYTTQAYVNLTDGFTCANCVRGAGLSSFEALTLKALLITSCTTVGSLVYFAFSFGVL